MEQIVSTHGISQRRACQLVGQSRSSRRYRSTRLPDEDEITEQIVQLTRDYGRYDYRIITAMLRLKGYAINHKRAYRIWRELGLKVPQKQLKRRRLWLNDGSCIRLRAEHPNHVWSYDFVEAKVGRGRKLKILNIIDENTRECLCSHAAFRIRSEGVKNTLRQIMLRRGTPEYIRSDNGSEFIAKYLRDWLADLSIAPMYITPGSPWENGFCESFNSRMVDELLNREIFETLFEARALLSRWVMGYNTVRPHSALGYRPPAPEARKPSAPFYLLLDMGSYINQVRLMAIGSNHTITAKCKVSF